MKSRRHHRALTLVELIVVMIVLVALAGVVVNRMEGVLTQAHVAATTSNLPTLESTVRARSLLKSGDVGDTFDSVIVDPSGSPTVASYMPGNAFWESLTLTADDVAALNAIGITQLVPANDALNLTANDATFGSHDQVPQVPTAMLAMAQAGGEDASMLASFNMTPAPGARYVAVGIGSQCSLVGGGEGSAFSEAPVHFGDTATTRANVAYTRYFLVFEIADQGTANSSVRFLGVAAPHENGLERNEAHLREFYAS